MLSKRKALEAVAETFRVVSDLSYRSTFLTSIRWHYDRGIQDAVLKDLADHPHWDLPLSLG